jgi:hypothetical protein
MSWTIPGMERRECPREYQEQVTAIGGKNRYGGPNFKIVWGQNEVDLAYGVDANGKRGQFQILKHGGIPAWFVDVWKAPECLGTPETWYQLTWDWQADAPAIGPYPERGLYFPASFNLFTRRVENNTLIIDAMPLTHWIIDLIIPNLLKEQDITFTQRMAATRNRMLMERQRAAKQIFDAYMDAAPAFGGVAGSYESNRERWMERVQQQQQGMKISRDQIVRRMGLGHKQHSFKP